MFRSRFISMKKLLDDTLVVTLSTFLNARVGEGASTYA
jgi:hypothetical protein